MKPLAGLKVLELARILAGPWCGQLLADLGAEVIKIERPGEGDDTRHWGPPFITDAAGDSWGAAYFHACNRGKSSVAVDLDSPDGQAVVKRLAGESDVVIENFKVGGLAKYGLDYSSLRRGNQRLICASITGFGQDGPYAQRAGYDYIVQGMGGLMDITGAPDGEPQKVGVAVVDIFTGLYTATAILAALRGRDLSGEGAYVDMALFDTAAAILANQGMNYLASGTSPSRLGNAHPNIAPYQVFAVADGHIIVAVGNDSQFRTLCELIDLKGLSTSPLYQYNSSRVANRQTLQAALEPVLLGYSRTEILARLEAAGVPAGPINRVQDVFADPQIVHRGLKLDLVSADGSRVPGIASPIVINGQRMAADTPSPALGSGQAEWKSSI